MVQRTSMAQIIMTVVIWIIICLIVLPTLLFKKDALHEKQELHKVLSKSGVLLASTLDSYTVAEFEDDETDITTYTYTLKYKYDYNGHTYYIEDSRDSYKRLKEEQLAHTLNIYVDQNNPATAVYQDVEKYNTGGVTFLCIVAIFVGVVCTMVFLS